MNKTSLKDRWRGAAGQDLARQVVVRLLLGADLEDLGLGTVDGRVDVRGLWLVSTKGLPGVTEPWHAPVAEGVVWRSLDLSYGTLRIDLRGSTVEGVVFDGVGWPQWRAESTTFRDCSFIRADVTDGCLDGGNSGLQDRELAHDPSRYERCDFTRTRTGPYGSFGRATFHECLFASTVLPSPAWLRGADLTRCTFTGRYRTVCFGWTGPRSEPAPVLEDVDVRGATFEGLEVHDVRGSGLITETSAEGPRKGDDGRPA